jgi:methanogenic corrinoid protein MtbC1
MASKEELLEALKDGVINYKEEQVKEASQQALDDGYLALEMIMDGLAAGMEVVGELYEKHEYFVPEVLMCADALYLGLDVLRPHVPESDSGSVAQVVIGSIQGDVHDIGKNLVKMMFDVAGWEVYDLGRDVPHDDDDHAGHEKGH